MATVPRALKPFDPTREELSRIRDGVYGGDVGFCQGLPADLFHSARSLILAGNAFAGTGTIRQRKFRRAAIFRIRCSDSPYCRCLNAITVGKRSSWDVSSPFADFRY